MNMKNLAPVFFSGLLILGGCKKAETANTATTEAFSIVSPANVPAAVTSAFSASFAGATEVEWHKRSAQFEVEFNHMSQRHESVFEDNGHEVSHHVSCTTAAVPAAVLTAFRSKYPSDNVTEWRLTSDGNWKAHFVRSGIEWEATFSASGSFIKEEHS